MIEPARAAEEVARFRGAPARSSSRTAGSVAQGHFERRVLSIVFPQLARGFLEDHNKRLNTDEGPSDELLAELFQASRTYLFRLLFLFYAESRDLAPAGNAFARRLKKIREEIAAEVEMQSGTGTSLFDRVLPLVAAMEKANPALRVAPNVPRFSLAHKIANRPLALAIDALSRDRDAATANRTFIDYNALDVRLVGSIYEATLDCKLRAEPKRNGRKVRLEAADDKTGRKMSGSYYTPSAIVEYLVANTVGPVLDEKLEALRPDFRRADHAGSAHRGLCDRLFDLKVVDPAMGCGHFLVEAVNFIAGRLFEFLKEFPNSRILDAVRRPRRGIRLSERRLLKWHVLKRCIYGVDLDPMAVALAKATLWLDAGISGKPSIFLDRHLRCGNALVGTVSTSGPSSAPTGGPADRRARRADPPRFDWEIEFPDAYAAAADRQPTGAAGFDCVVGNPPYVRIQNLHRTLVEYLQQNFETAAGKFDLYIPFLERGTELLRPNGLLGMIVPNKFLTAVYGAAFRRFAGEKRLVRQLVDFESQRVFAGAGAYCCLVFLGGRPSDTIAVSRGFLKRPIARKTALAPSQAFGAAPWSVRTPPAAPRDAIPLKAACRAIFQGLITGADRLLIGIRRGDTVRLGRDAVDFDPEIFRPILKGPDVRRFSLRFSNHYVVYPYRLVGGRTELMAEDEIAARHPGAYRYLCEHRRELSDRGSPSMDYPAWYAHWCPRALDRFAAPKIVTQVLALKAAFALDREGTYTFVGGGNAGVYGVIPDRADEDRLWLLLAVLNSGIFDVQVQAGSSRFRGDYFSYARRFIENAAIPRVSEIDLAASLPRRIIELAKARADGDSKSTPLEAELDAAVDELYRCGTR